jgi:hypothetical protein
MYYCDILSTQGGPTDPALSDQAGSHFISFIFLLKIEGSSNAISMVLAIEYFMELSGTIRKSYCA